MDGETFTRIKWPIILFCCGVLAGVAGSWLFGPIRTEKHFSERIVEREVPVVRETIKHTTDTEIAYVPKTVISEVVINPETGKPEKRKTKEKTDVEAKIEKPTVNVKVNGQPYTFSLLQDESQKFQDGKISLRQDSTVGIELAIKPQVIDKTKTGGIDVFVGKYSGIGINFNRIGLDYGIKGNEKDIRLRWRAIEW